MHSSAAVLNWGGTETTLMYMRYIHMLSDSNYSVHGRNNIYLK